MCVRVWRGRSGLTSIVVVAHFCDLERLKLWELGLQLRERAPRARAAKRLVEVEARERGRAATARSAESSGKDPQGVLAGKVRRDLEARQLACRYKQCGRRRSVHRAGGDQRERGQVAGSRKLGQVRDERVRHLGEPRES